MRKKDPYKKKVFEAAHFMEEVKQEIKEQLSVRKKAKEELKQLFVNQEFGVSCLMLSWDYQSLSYMLNQAERGGILKELLEIRDYNLTSVVFYYKDSVKEMELILSKAEKIGLFKEFLLIPTGKPCSLLMHVKNSRIIKLILDKAKKAGLLKELLLTKDEAQSSVLMYVSDEQVVKLLLNEAESLGILKEFLLMKNKYNVTFLTRSIAHQLSYSTIKLIIDKAKKIDELKDLLISKDGEGNSLLVYMVVNSILRESAQLIIDEIDNIGPYVLFNLLLQTNDKGHSFLFSICEKTNSELFEVIFEKIQEKHYPYEEKLTELLLIQNYNGESFLMKMARDVDIYTFNFIMTKAWGLKAYKEIFKKLLLMKNNMDESFLVYAVDFAVVDFLLDVAEKLQILEDLLMSTQSSGSILMYMITENTQLNGELRERQKELQYKTTKLFLHKAERIKILKQFLLAQDTSGRTFLHYVGGDGVINQEILSLLLNEAKNLEILEDLCYQKDKEGKNLLNYLDHSYLYNLLDISFTDKNEILVELIYQSLFKPNKDCIKNIINDYSLDKIVLSVLMQKIAKNIKNHIIYESKDKLIFLFYRAYIGNFNFVSEDNYKLYGILEHDYNNLTIAELHLKYTVELLAYLANYIDLENYQSIFSRFDIAFEHIRHDFNDVYDVEFTKNLMKKLDDEFIGKEQEIIDEWRLIQKHLVGQQQENIVKGEKSVEEEEKDKEELTFFNSEDEGGENQIIDGDTEGKYFDKQDWMISGSSCAKGISYINAEKEVQKLAIEYRNINSKIYARKTFQRENNDKILVDMDPEKMCVQTNSAYCMRYVLYIARTMAARGYKNVIVYENITSRNKHAMVLIITESDKQQEQINDVKQQLFTLTKLQSTIGEVQDEIHGSSGAVLSADLLLDMAVMLVRLDKLKNTFNYIGENIQMLGRFQTEEVKLKVVAGILEKACYLCSGWNGVPYFACNNFKFIPGVHYLIQNKVSIAINELQVASTEVMDNLIFQCIKLIICNGIASFAFNYLGAKMSQAMKLGYIGSYVVANNQYVYDAVSILIDTYKKQYVLSKTEVETYSIVDCNVRQYKNLTMMYYCEKEEILHQIKGITIHGGTIDSDFYNTNYIVY